MRTVQLTSLLLLTATLSACGLGETAATTANLQAQQAQQAQQQMQQLKQQIDAANVQNQQRLDDALKDAQ
jgi:cell division protein FtsB